HDGDPNLQVETVERSEAVEIGCVVAGVEGAPEVPFAKKLPDGGSLVNDERRQHLEHLAPEAGDEALFFRAQLDVLERRASGLFVLCAAVVERCSQPLVLRRGPTRLGEELLQAPAPLGRLAVELQSVVAD